MQKILHGFDGSCRPNELGMASWSSQQTFSVGIFPILPKASGKGTKRGAVKVRVKGYVGNPDAVYDKAREIMDLLNAGEYTGPKTVKVG